MTRERAGSNGPGLATNAVVLVLVMVIGILAVFLRPVQSEDALPDTGAFYQEYEDDINLLSQEIFALSDSGEPLIDDAQACWELASKRLQKKLYDVVMVNENTIFFRCGSMYHLSNGIVKIRNQQTLAKHYPHTGLDGGISYYYIAENTYGFFSSSALE